MSKTNKAVFVCCCLDPSWKCIIYFTVIKGDWATITRNMTWYTQQNMDCNAAASTWMLSPPHTWAFCDLDLWPPESNHVISMAWWIFPVDFIKTSRNRASPRHVTRPRVRVSHAPGQTNLRIVIYSLLKPLMKYRTNNIWPPRPDYGTGQHQNIMPLPMLSGPEAINISWNLDVWFSRYERSRQTNNPAHIPTHWSQ